MARQLSSASRAHRPRPAAVIVRPSDCLPAGNAYLANERARRPRTIQTNERCERMSDEWKPKQGAKERKSERATFFKPVRNKIRRNTDERDGVESGAGQEETPRPRRRHENAGRRSYVECKKDALRWLALPPKLLVVKIEI